MTRSLTRRHDCSDEATVVMPELEEVSVMARRWWHDRR
jgi:hypothetical protein